MAITILELNHVTLHVRDLAASEHFYGNILGLKKLPRPNFDFPGAWYAFGNQDLHLIYDNNLSSTDRHNHHFALKVEDTYQVKEELEAKGFSDFESHGLRPDGAVQLFLKDPDGYRIELTSLLS